MTKNKYKFDLRLPKAKQIKLKKLISSPFRKDKGGINPPLIKLLYLKLL